MVWQMIEEENALAKREEMRNARITESLTGRMRPPDSEIIKTLKERRVKDIGYFYWEMPILRERNKYHCRKPRGRR